MNSSIGISVTSTWIATLLIIITFSTQATAGGADVIDATAIRESTGRYTVSATILHKDEGWEHYVNRFEVLTPDGKLIGARYLGHPHVNEQPFTRSATSVNVPEGVKEIRIRAHDNVHGFSGKEFTLKLSK
jgi:hypothetical protein